MGACSQENGSDILIPANAVEFDVHGNFSFQVNTAIDTNTFGTLIDNNYHLRIPFCETTNKGTIIVGADVRENTYSDQTAISLGIVRSTDEGKNFITPQIVIPHTNESEWDRAMDGTILVDRNSGRIFIFAHRIKTTDVWETIHKKGNYGFDFVYVYSDDDGLTWSEPQSFRKSLTLDIDGTSIVSLFGGVGHGITMTDGTLVLPIQCKMAMEDDSAAYNIQSGIAYSRDGGNTWKCESLVSCYSSENMVVEYEKGKLLLNAKSYISKRRVFISADLGKSWEVHESDKTLIEPIACQGTLHKIGKWGFFLNPRNESTRSNLTLQITDDFVSWHPILELYPEHCFGYSCICNEDQKLYAVSETMGGAILFYKIYQE